MTKQQIIKYSILGVIAIAGLILIISLVTKKRPGGSTDEFKELYQKLYESEKAHRETLQGSLDDNRQERDSLFKLSFLATEALSKNRIIHQTIDRKFNDISKEVDALGRNTDSIRRAYADLKD